MLCECSLTSSLPRGPHHWDVPWPTGWERVGSAGVCISVMHRGNQLWAATGLRSTRHPGPYPNPNHPAIHSQPTDPKQEKQCLLGAIEFWGGLLNSMAVAIADWGNRSGIFSAYNSVQPVRETSAISVVYCFITQRIGTKSRLSFLQCSYFLDGFAKFMDGTPFSVNLLTCKYLLKSHLGDPRPSSSCKVTLAQRTRQSPALTLFMCHQGDLPCLNSKPLEIRRSRRVRVLRAPAHLLPASWWP